MRQPQLTDQGQNLEVLVEDEAIRISMRSGRNDRCILSFSGVGLDFRGPKEVQSRGPREVQREEFARSTSNSSENSIIFVIDKNRTWMNYIRDQVLACLSEALRDFKYVITLGNSMGGFSALYIASQIPNCYRAIAFSPQFSVNPAFMPPEETRWVRYRQAISEHRIGHAFDHPSSKVEYWIFFGTANHLDQAHADLFEEARPPKSHIVHVNDGDHDIAKALSQAGALNVMLNRLFEPSSVSRHEVETILSIHGFKSTVSHIS